MNTPDPPHWTQYSCFVVFRSVWAHLGSFRCFMILGSKQAELLQLMQKFVPQSCVRIFCDKSTRSTPSDPKLVFWCVSQCLVDLGSFLYYVKLDAKPAKLVQLMQRFVPRSRFVISQNDCTDPPHRTINSCFGAFHSARVHLGMFHYGNKLGVKSAEVVQLMQKFVPRSHIGIFRNKRTRSTPLDPKLMFSCVSQCLGAFGTISLLHETRCKTG